MRNRVFSRLVSLAVCVCMMGPWQVPASAFAQQTEAAPESAATASDASAAEEVVAPDYQRQYFADMYNAGQVQVDNAGVSIALDEPSGTLVFSGKRKSLSGSTITISKTLDFSNAAVGRFNIAGMAQQNKHIDISCYLDNSKEAFFTTQLALQKTEGDWTNPSEYSVNMLPLNITGQHTLSIKISTVSVTPGFALSHFEFAESSVPVLNLDIDESLGTVLDMNMSSDHSVNCYGTVSIDVPQGYTSPLTGEAVSGTSGALDLDYMRGRGNSTWENEVKKPYKLKLDSSTNLLGMGKSKNWALMANAMDKTEMRNMMTSWLGDELGSAYIVSMEPVEVIMNGSYLGSYMLSENVRQEKTRVAIADLDDTPDATDEATISGGYLLSLGNWTLDADRLHFTTERANGIFQVESPDLYTSQNAAQYNYIKNYVQSVEDAIYTGGDYASLMDVESAARYFWFQELSGNGDGFTSGSCYLYKDRDGKLCWGPLWDFDLAWGCNDGSADFQGARLWRQTEKFWNEELFKDQSYVDAVKAQWPEFKEALSQLTAEGGVLDRFAAALRVSVAYNNEYWGVSDGTDQGEQAQAEASTAHSALSFGVASFDNAVSYLRSWLEARSQWVDENLSTLDLQPATVTFKDSDGTVLTTRTYYLKHSFGELPETPAKSGYVFKGWKITTVTTLEELLAEMGVTEEEYRNSLIENEGKTAAQADAEIERYRKGVENTEYVDASTKVASKDLVLTAEYTKLSSVTKVDKIYSPYKTYYCIYDAKGTTFLRLPIQVEPFTLEGNRITCTLGDSNLLTRVGDDDDFNNYTFAVNGSGETTITFTPLVGEPLTIKVHVYSEAEASELGVYDASLNLSKSHISITQGTYGAIPFDEVSEGAVNYKFPDFVSTNEDVLSVGQGGVIYGKKAGTASVCYTDNGNFCCCNVTVESASPAVGDTVTAKGLKFKVVSDEAGAQAAACLGATNAKAKTVSVPKAVKVKGVSCKVTTVAAKAFKGMGKLKAVTLAANVDFVEAGAFKGCKALRKVTFKSTSMPKVDASAFKGVKSACKFFVPKGQKAYYAIVLKGHKVIAR